MSNQNITSEMSPRAPGAGNRPKREKGTAQLGGRRSVGNLIYSTGGGALIGVVVLWVAFAIASPYFLTTVNQANIGRQMVEVGIVSIGMTVVIMSGGIDLSVGSTVGLAGTLLASGIVQAQLSPFVGTLIALAVGLAVGLVNGVLIAYFRVPPIVATLAMLSVARGIALTYTNGAPESGITNSYAWLGRGNLGAIPISVIVMLILYLLAYVVLRHTRSGLYVSGIGSNAEAARLSGINVKLHLLGIYAFTGIMAGFAGAILASRLGSGQPTSGQDLELSAITAVVLGGTSIRGGRGTLLGTILGALLITVIGNGLDLLNVNSFIQQIAIGGILAIAVVASELTQRRRKRS
jgi:ribose transport system permease protein